MVLLELESQTKLMKENSIWPKVIWLNKGTAAASQKGQLQAEQFNGYL